jgi:hypothetical protein
MSIDNKLEKPLTILIPTYNRAPKLRRFLSYLLKIEAHQKIVLSNVEFIIADGSDKTDYKNNQLIDQIGELGIHIEYFHLPRVGLKERFIIVSREIKTNHVLVCGDDDLVDFEGVRDWLDNKNKFPVDYVYAGRFSNILGLSIFGLKVSCLERPYYGFKITAEDVEVRLLMYGVANAFGVTSLSYAIQPTLLFSEFWSMTKGRQLYYGGLEFLHQIFLTARSKIIFSGKTLIYRDFTYIDYKSDKLREAPATDKYQYFGEEAVNQAVQIISKYSSVDSSRALNIIENIIDIQASVLPSRLRLQNMYTNQGNKICSRSDLITMAAIKSVWFRAYLETYPRKPAIKRFIILSLPACMTQFYSKIKSFFIHI